MSDGYYIIDAGMNEIIATVKGVPDKEELERLANANECDVAIISATHLAFCGFDNGN